MAALTGLALWATAGPAAAAWSAVLFRLPAAVKLRRHVAVQANFGALVCLAASMTFLVPPVYVHAGKLLGLSNVARLLSDCSGMAMACFATVVLLSQANPEGTARGLGGRRFGVLAIVLAVMSALFVAGHFDVQDVHFLARYGSRPIVLAYLVVPLALLGVLTAEVAYHCWQYGRQLTGTHLRAGLLWIAFAGLVGVAYSSETLAYLAARSTGAGPGVFGDQLTISQSLLGAATLAIAVGDTLPDWGDRAVRRWRDHCALHQLHPLWADLCKADPGIPLTPPMSRYRDAVRFRDQQTRLDRRVIEIRDGQLRLGPFRQAQGEALALHLAQQERTATTAQVHAIVEAAALAGAIIAKRRGLRTGTPNERFAPPVGGCNLDTEADLLVQVARCYATSPVVDAVRALTANV